MPKKSQSLSLDLHQVRFESSNIQSELEIILDRFIYPHLQNGKTKKLQIIVGKGLNSKKFIKGKNCLRYYTEIYLQKLNLDFKNIEDFFGGSGAIEVYL